ncbi:hypothetical protein [Rhizobacter sp. Root16D2]|uniref:hypothetical protein n=1 Tax=Rhizobacter sp. Root16D2 TaxID=1736479 RepID=UPI0012FA5931|nr:hypothetical protein [Rhizobacter sp. Root16D2]
MPALATWNPGACAAGGIDENTSRRNRQGATSSGIRVAHVGKPFHSLNHRARPSFFIVPLMRHRRLSAGGALQSMGCGVVGVNIGH